MVGITTFGRKKVAIVIPILLNHVDLVEKSFIISALRLLCDSKTHFGSNCEHYLTFLQANLFCITFNVVGKTISGMAG